MGRITIINEACVGLVARLVGNSFQSPVPREGLVHLGRNNQMHKWPFITSRLQASFPTPLLCIGKRVYLKQTSAKAVLLPWRSVPYWWGSRDVSAPLMSDIGFLYILCHLLLMARITRCAVHHSGSGHWHNTLYCMHKISCWTKYPYRQRHCPK